MNENMNISFSKEQRKTNEIEITATASRIEYLNNRNIIVWGSDNLLCGENEVLIRHGEDNYILRLTRNGGLLLNK